MQEHTTTETVEHTRTVYTCDVEGCGFTTESEYEAERHHGKEHAVAAKESVGGQTLLRFDSKEAFDAYAFAEDIEDRHTHWDGPGWYRSFVKEDTRGCSCCYDNYEHLHPACWIAFDWQKKIQKYRGRLAEMAEFLGDTYLLEDA